MGQPQRPNAAKMVFHMAVCLCRDEAAWKSWTRASTAVARSAAEDKAGSAPRETARRPGASSLSGGKAPAHATELRLGERERRGNGVDEGARCHPQAGGTEVEETYTYVRHTLATPSAKPYRYSCIGQYGAKVGRRPPAAGTKKDRHAATLDPPTPPPPVNNQRDVHEWHAAW